MNYGMFLLGTSLVIVHFLRLLCHVHAHPLNQKTFRYESAYDEYPFDPDNTIADDTVRGWLTNDRHLRIRNLIKSLWSNSSSKQALNTFFELAPGHTFFDSSYYNGDNSLSSEAGIIEECQFKEYSESPPTIDDYYEENDSTTALYDEYPSNLTVGKAPRSPHNVSLHIRSELNATLEEYRCKYFSASNTVICDDPEMTAPIVLPEGIKLELLIVNFTQVQTLGPRAFGRSEVQSVKLHWNILKCIHPNAFDGLTGVNLLSLAQNHLEYIRFSDFHNLPNLTTLSFEYNKINLANAPSFYTQASAVDLRDSREVVDDYYDTLLPVLPSLRILSLVGNPLKVIPRTFFYPLRSSPIELLSLMNSQLTLIESEGLAWLPNLVTLDLSENPELMENLDVALEGITSPLQELFLTSNNLARIPTKALTQVKNNLTTLDLRGNLLDSISKSCIPKGMTALKHLNFDNCRIRTLSIQAFDHLDNLETLILTNNRLSQVPTTVSNLRSLITLDLTGNNPSLSSTVLAGQAQSVFKIPSQVFKNLSHLRTLSLNSLPLTFIAKDSLLGLTDLVFLFMSNTDIEVIEDFAFQDMSSLSQLYLTHNKLTRIGGYTFYGLQSLKYLFLDDNNIMIDSDDSANSTSDGHLGSTTLSPDPFAPDPVDDVYDDETFLPSDPLPISPIHINSSVPPFQFLPKLEELHMANNKVRCMQSAHFNFLTNLKLLDLTGNIVTSWQVPILGNMSKLRRVHLAKNTIGPITPAMLADFTFLDNTTSAGIIDLSDNPFVCDENACKFIQLANSSHFITFDKRDSRNFHVCIDIETNKYKRMFTDATDLCTPKGPSITEKPVTLSPPGGENGEDPVDPITKYVTTTATSTLAIIAISMFFVLSVGVLGYKKRFHLKYFWFVVRFNVVNLPNLNISNNKRKGSLHPYDFDVFLSYNHTDRAFVEDSLVPNMEGTLESYQKAGDCPPKILIGDEYKEIHPDKYLPKSESKKLKVCIHERDFTAGVPITENIVDFVDRSRKVVVVVSKNYLESQWCLYEMNLAYHRLIESKRKSFLVILLEDIPPILRTKSLNYLLLSRTYLEWPGSDATESEKNNFWKRLKQSLESL